ncbi:recombinase RAD52 Ecym_4110 [Eremothecium cymbalariae DBVPG|uniref:DNA repair and recombination protein RAD52 n=1 Tax=Eremothecium cymbalariae (strain CBS 270.75 / DBVPG 7215 / KCTC 17166 / NRRL Y-17582) TaxID=931890 RepID=G8JT36_ERECY|nr:hypothetical protein Ecym_4110 [Eremothecium cymbalariae DBVPG\
MSDDKKGHMGSFEDIQSKLDKRLGPEYISKRIGHGSTRVAYIEGWKAINLANQIFGFNGWSSEVKSVTVDFMDEKQGRFTIGCTAIVRVTLGDGTFREDIGYGTVDNERRKSAAFERAKKSAVTDALKRSLRSFGNALGNCLYDKDFLSRIDKVKFEPPDFDEGNLFRPADEISEVSRSNTVPEHHDGPIVKKRNLVQVAHAQVAAATAASRPSNVRPSTYHTEGAVEDTELPQEEATYAPQRSPTENEHEDLLDDSFMFSDELQDDDLMNIGSVKKPPIASAGMHAPAQIAVHKLSRPTVPGKDVPVAFVTAKAAPNLQNKTPIPTDQMFNPKFQAQSIKHTVDQSTSTHVKVNVLKDKGIDQHRDSFYAKFAPKGKILDSTDTSNTSHSSALAQDHPRLSPSLSLIQDENNTNTSSLPKPTLIELPTPQHAKSNIALPKLPIQRREVGRPKINHPNLRRPSIQQ